MSENESEKKTVLLVFVGTVPGKKTDYLYRLAEVNDGQPSAGKNLHFGSALHRGRATPGLVITAPVVFGEGDALTVHSPRLDTGRWQNWAQVLEWQAEQTARDQVAANARQLSKLRNTSELKAQLEPVRQIFRNDLTRAQRVALLAWLIDYLIS